MQYQTLASLPVNTPAKITKIHGGLGLERKLHVMGIRKGQTIKIICKQPLRGPITIQISGFQMTIGRGMAQKIEVDVVK